MKRLTLLPLLLILAFVIAACGGTETAPAEDAAMPEPMATAVPDEPTEEPVTSPGTIVDIAVNDGRFNTLVTAVVAAGLDETLSGEGPFTVFAPTDDAFAALPAGTLEELLADPQGALTNILLYHVVSGQVMAADVVGLEAATAVSGEEIAINATADGVFLNENVQVIITDIEADNGVIHVIDAVLLPPSITAEAALPSIAEIAAGDENFSTLLTAVQAAGLAETLAGEGSFTVFAPTNAAFEALPAGTLEALLADPEGALRDILLYHVVDGQVMAEDVVGLTSAASLQGEEIGISIVDGNVVLNESATVVAVDVAASNGVVHVIDAVILPPSLSAAEATDDTAAMADLPSIAEIAAADENFSTLVFALDAAGLVETLAGEGSFTVFAPTNAAFEALPEGALDGLVADPEGALRDVLLYHVVDGKVMAADVVEFSAALSLQGEEISISIVDGAVILNGNAEVVITDIEASNGVIHVIDAVILPPSLSN